ncbi:unnamed protein product [Heterobilharzia americana]|nr:unnamed protein product [Heterobilharzia americana]
MGTSTSEPAYNYFTQDFLEASVPQTGDYLSSPFSVFLLLATLLGSGGVKGNTKVQIAEALEIYDCTGKQEIISQLFTPLYHNLTAEQVDGKKMITIGNGMFIRNGAKIKSDFSRKMTKKFFTDVCNVDFSDQRDTTRKINGWVSNKTNEMIPELLKQPLKKDTYLALINTLYFKGKWQKPFPKYSTSENTFKPLNQPVIKIPMMQITDRIDYGKFSNFKVHVISKEFSNPRFTFVVILPIESGKLQYPERFLRGEVQLPNLMKKLHPTQVYLKLPRFRMDSSFDLIETLGMLGITDLFDSVLADMKDTFIFSLISSIDRTYLLMAKIGQGIQIPVSWVLQKDGKYPVNAISADEGVYIGRCKHRNEFIPGKFLSGNGKCYCPYDGDELEFTEYELLCDTSVDKYTKGYEWVKAKDGHYPKYAIVAGIAADGNHF